MKRRRKTYSVEADETYQLAWQIDGFMYDYDDYESDERDEPDRRVLRIVRKISQGRTEYLKSYLQEVIDEDKDADTVADARVLLRRLNQIGGNE